jgi:hypothetical protein
MSFTKGVVLVFYKEVLPARRPHDKVLESLVHRKAMGGYAGTMAYIDLTSGVVTKKETPPALKEAFLGGRGFTSHTLLSQVGRQVAPLDPDAAVVIAWDRLPAR